MIKKKITKYDKIFLIIVVFLAFSLRFYNTGSLTGGDDSEYALFTHYILEGKTNPIYPQIPDEPVSYKGFLEARPFAILPLVLSTVLLGHNSVAVKLPSIIFSCLSVIFLFFLLRRHFSKAITWTATFLFAVNPFHISFTRIGINDGLLTLLVIGTALSVIKGLEENNIKYFYLAGILGVINMLTTNYRGLVPLLTLIPFVVIFKPNFKQWKHLVIVAVSSICLWLSYYVIPLLWGNKTILEYFIMRTFQAVKINADKQFYSLSESLKLIGSYQFLTPFLGLLVISTLFGIYYSAKQIKQPKYALWICWLLSSIIIYAQGQPYPNRQVIIVPAFVVLSSIGLWTSAKKMWTSKSVSFPLQTFLIVIYILFITKVFPSIFPQEWSSMKNIPLLQNLFSFYSSILVYVLLLTIFIGGLFITYVRKTNLKIKKKISVSIITLFLIGNFIVTAGLVITGVARFHRPDQIDNIADYLVQHNQNSKYSCLAYFEDRTLTYLTGKTCADVEVPELEWIKQNVKNDNINFYVENLYYTGPERLSQSEIEFKERIPETYSWVITNSKDITQDIGINPDLYMVREFN